MEKQWIKENQYRNEAMNQHKRGNKKINWKVVSVKTKWGTILEST